MEYTVEAIHQEGLRFVATAGPHSVTTDYPLKPDESGGGQRPLELLLASLASCAGGALMVLLRRGGHPVTGLSVRARGQRRSEHPTVFTEIALEFAVRGSLDPSVVAEALRDSEARICPVWAMLKPATPITSSFLVVES
jgi:putative redox protein